MAINNAIQNVFDQSFLRHGEELEDFLLFLLKGGLNKQSRDAVGVAAAKFVNSRTTGRGLDTSGFELNDLSRPIVEHIQKAGYAEIDPAFSARDLEKIGQYFKDKKAHFGSIGFDEKGRKGEAIADDLPTDIRFAHYRAEDICKCPPMYRAIHSPHLLGAMANYLGAPPTVSSVGMWWSFPSPLPPGGMQLFHHDRGDFRSCNLFVYLTEVSEITGPHSFVPGTHDIKALYDLATARFGNAPDQLQSFWRWMEIHRKTDQDVDQFFQADEIKVFTGPKGTSFFEDTRGLHKATLPIVGPRLAFEIVYSVLPKFNEKIVPVYREDLAFDANTEALEPLIRYATRQFYY